MLTANVCVPSEVRISAPAGIKADMLGVNRENVTVPVAATAGSLSQCQIGHPAIQIGAIAGGRTRSSQHQQNEPLHPEPNRGIGLQHSAQRGPDSQVQKLRCGCLDGSRHRLHKRVEGAERSCIV